MPNFYNSAVLSNILRYLIQAAQDKRVVPYHELENIFGLSHNMAGYYAGMVGEFCIEKKLPFLNALLVNTSQCKPSGGFDHYENLAGKNWGECLAECWRFYHQKTTREHQVKNFSGLTSAVRGWNPPEIPGYMEERA